MLRVREVKVPLASDDLKKYIAKKLNVSKEEIKSFKINKKSIDARKDVFFVYEVDIEIDNENKYLKNKGVLVTPKEEYSFNNFGDKKLNNRPVIIGSGPAGLFCAYSLAENGYRPIIIERGEKIEDRVKTVEKFWGKGILNENSNVQFGEGGAGTFSDGKLNTLVKDKSFRMKKVFETFVECGAPEEILYLNKPHIGTDQLRNVIINIRNKIISLGGEFRYNTTMSDIVIKDNNIDSIFLNDDLLKTDVLVLAIGHSSRDTFKMLYDKKLKMSAKNFAVGIRCQHSQSLINKAQYGDIDLLPASYKLTYNAGGRGVYTFCMCPGGYVVNASSERGHLAINGMSNYNRDSGVANSAIVVTISKEDFGLHPLDGINFQKKLEERAYNVGEGMIPVQTYKDFKENKKTNSLEGCFYKFKGEYKESNINEIYPKYITDAIKEAMGYFGTKIKDFDNDNVVLAGVESRTSSPVRIERDDNFESNIKGIYPCGEGAGYAGGITTSAMDGIKVAEAIMKIYKNY